jgi:hypothetical protein
MLPVSKCCSRHDEISVNSLLEKRPSSFCDYITGRQEARAEKFFRLYADCRGSIFKTISAYYKLKFSEERPEWL